MYESFPPLYYIHLRNVLLYVHNFWFIHLKNQYTCANSNFDSKSWVTWLTFAQFVYFLRKMYLLFNFWTIKFTIMLFLTFTYEFLNLKTYSPKWIVTTVHSIYCSYYPFRWISLYHKFAVHVVTLEQIKILL